MSESQQKNIADLIIDGLKKAVAELEEFRVQAALGKAEARDAFEAAKKDLHQFMHEAEQRYGVSNKSVEDVARELRIAVETLQVQLALGKAETRDLFEEQRRKIVQALQALENFIDKNELTAEYKESLHREIHKFKIKLEILKLRYELNSITAHQEFEARKKEFGQKIEKLGDLLREKEKKAEKSWDHFKEEVNEAYADMKKTFLH